MASKVLGRANIRLDIDTVVTKDIITLDLKRLDKELVKIQWLDDQDRVITSVIHKKNLISPTYL